MPAYVFTPAEAMAIFERLQISSAEVEIAMQTQPLKAVAADIGLGHMRLSACIKALDIKVPSKSSKVGATLRNQSDLVKHQRAQSLNIEEVTAEIPTSTVKALSARFGVTTEWLEDVAVKHDLRFATRSEVDLAKGKNRAVRSDERFESLHGSTVKRLVAENASLRQITKEVGNSRALARFMRTECSEWFDDAAVKERAKRASKYSSAQVQKTRFENALVASKESLSDLDLSQAYHKKLLAIDEISSMMGVKSQVGARIIEARLGVSPHAWAAQRRAGRRVLARGGSLLLSDFPALESLASAEDLTVPPELSAYPALFLEHEVLSDANRLKAFITKHGFSLRADVASALPTASPASVGNLIADWGLDVNLAPKRDSYLPLIEALPIPLATQEGQEQFAQLVENGDVTTFREACNVLSIDETFGRQLQGRGLLPRHWNQGSDFELQVKQVLLDSGVEFQSRVKGLLPNGRQELDFWIPGASLAIEVNPTFTHNSSYGWFYSHKHAKASDYHLKKVADAREASINLIMLYERDLIEPRWSNVTIPFISLKAKGPARVMYARNVKVSLASASEVSVCRSFLAKYHSQGAGGAKHYYRMVDTTGTLVGVASFSPSRPLAADGVTALELKRLAFAPGTQVRYGISKVLAELKRTMPSLQKVYSYSRNDMGNGAGYSASGFEFVRETGPNLSYVSPSDANDFYSWAINSPWGSRGGLIARTFGAAARTKEEIDELILHDLPHRSNRGKGYVKVYGAGSKLWCFRY